MLPGPDHPGPDYDDLVLADPADLEADYLRHILRYILDAGVAVAQTITHAATGQTAALINGDAGPHDSATADLAVAFDRTARAVRRTVALFQRIGAAPREARRKRTDARKEIIRAVEDAIERLPPDDNSPDNTPDTAPDELRAELHERLDDPALDDDIQTRPVPDIIAEICRDLGLAAQSSGHRWKRRTPTDIQHLCAAAARRPAPGPDPAWPGDPPGGGPTPPAPAPARSPPSSSSRPRTASSC